MALPQTDTHPVEADLGLSVAGGEVGLGLGGGALGRAPVAHALVGTLRLLSALVVAALVIALVSTAGALAGTEGAQDSSVGCTTRRFQTVDLCEKHWRGN